MGEGWPAGQTQHPQAWSLPSGSILCWRDPSRPNPVSRSAWPSVCPQLRWGMPRGSLRGWGPGPRAQGAEEQRLAHQRLAHHPRAAAASKTVGGEHRASAKAALTAAAFRGGVTGPAHLPTPHPHPVGHLPALRSVLEGEVLGARRESVREGRLREEQEGAKRGRPSAAAAQTPWPRGPLSHHQPRVRGPPLGPAKGLNLPF